jgi:threonine synthase
MRSLVLIPDGKISWSKLSQALEYGAVTCQVRTDFDGCMRVLNDIVSRKPIYLLNSINPFRLEGQKTVAFELMEQFDWEPPDHIVVPGGNLGNSSALGKAVREMHELGLIKRLPKISVIQAEGANALVRTVREKGGKELVSVHADTMATAIRIGNPASWKKAVRVLEETAGTVEQVSEVEIALAKVDLGKPHKAEPFIHRPGGLHRPRRMQHGARLAEFACPFDAELCQRLADTPAPKGIVDRQQANSDRICHH